MDEGSGSLPQKEGYQTTMNINQSNPNFHPHKKPNEGTTTPSTPVNKPVLVNNTPQVLPNVPWRAEALPSERLLNAIGKLDFII
jgi:hypothetical protein